MQFHTAQLSEEKLPVSVAERDCKTEAAAPTKIREKRIRQINFEAREFSKEALCTTLCACARNTTLPFMLSQHVSRGPLPPVPFLGRASVWAWHSK